VDDESWKSVVGPRLALQGVSSHLSINSEQSSRSQPSRREAVRWGRSTVVPAGRTSHHSTAALVPVPAGHAAAVCAHHVCHHVPAEDSGQAQHVTLLYSTQGAAHTGCSTSRCCTAPRALHTQAAARHAAVQHPGLCTSAPCTAAPSTASFQLQPASCRHSLPLPLPLTPPASPSPPPVPTRPSSSSPPNSLRAWMWSRPGS
jgi:hypothetical protein